MKKELLMKKYKSGDLGPEDQELLESYIEQGIIKVEELADLNQIHEQVSIGPESIPSDSMRQRFSQMLSAKIKKSRHSHWWEKLWRSFSMDVPGVQIYRLAFSAGLVVIGLIGGWLLSPSGRYQEQISEITGQVHEMKEMMVLSMLEKPSPTQRLKAVNMSAELPESNQKVTDALFQTLNRDENVNVRLAALETLAGYTNNPTVRERLIQSISLQESPIVQASLAELMVAIQEKGSVGELKKLLEKQSTDEAIKERLAESIGQLI